MKHLFSLLVMVALGSACVANAALSREEEDKLVATLKSDGELKARFDACRELGRSGSTAAVPALAALLGDEKLSHMARFGLESIPGPEVDAALRGALDTVKGDLLVGVINSIGVRRDGAAVPALAKRLQGDDPALAFAAAAALGQIATPEAGEVLAQQLQSKPETSADGCLRFADAMLRSGKSKEAAKMFDALKQSKAADQIRLAASRGAIVARGEDGIDLLREGLGGGEYGPFIMALSALRDCPGKTFTKAATDALAVMPAERLPALCDALGARGDRSALPELLKLAGAGTPNLRAAAIKAIAKIGDPASFATLLQLATDSDEVVATAARNGIGGFAGREADDAVLALLASDKVGQRQLGIELVYQRRIAAALPKLLRTAHDADSGVRLASIEALGRLAGNEEVGPLLGILQRTSDPAELKAAEKAINATCNRLSTPSATKIVIQKAEYGNLPDGPLADVTQKVRSMVKMGAIDIEVSNAQFGDPASGVMKKFHLVYTVDGAKHQTTVGEGETITLADRVLPDDIGRGIAEAFGPSKGEARAALLRIMSRNADDRALAALRAAMKTGEAAAARALCDWASPAALSDLMALMKSGGDETIRALAFRGAIRLAPRQDAAPAKRAATLGELLSAAGTEADRKLVLASLAEVPCAETFKLAADRLADAALKSEAALAAVSIAEQLKGPALQAAKPTLQDIAKDAGSDTGKRAAALLK